MRGKLIALGSAALVVVILVVFWALNKPTPEQTAISASVAKLVEVQGTVSLVKGGSNEFNAVKGMTVTEGDLLRTGNDGFVTVQYLDGSETSLNGNTELVFQKLKLTSSSKQVSLKLKAGSIWNKVQKLLNVNDQYEVETPTAVMGVRGTLYLVSVKPDGSSACYVFDGKIAARLLAQTGNERLVTAGKKLEVLASDQNLQAARDIDLKEFVQLLNPTLLAQVLKDIDQRVKELSAEAKSGVEKNRQTPAEEAVKQAADLARQAQELALLAAELVDEITNSPKANAVEQLLQSENITLAQQKTFFQQQGEEAKAIEEQALKLISEDTPSEPTTPVNNGQTSSGNSKPTQTTSPGGTGPSDTEAVTAVLSSLQIGFNEGDSAQTVTQNLNLPTTGDEGTTISWSSDNPDVIDNSGQVIRPSYLQGEATVTLTATITRGSVSERKTFTLVVEKLPETDAEAVTAAKGSLTIGYSGQDNASGVTSDITLPAVGADGTLVAWTSYNPLVIDSSGHVTRPSYTQGDAMVTLKATILKGQATGSRTFILVVSKLPKTDAEAVSVAKDSLAIGFSGQDNPSNVTANINLPAAGADGTSVSWLSSNPAVIDSTGRVARPSYLQGDATVLLTATITKGTASTNSSYTVVVKKLPETDAEAISIAISNLTIGYSGQDTAASVTGDLTLPSTGADGTSVTWSSNNPQVIDSGGHVIRPSFVEGDATVILTATITKGSASEIKSFSLTVKALDPSAPAALIRIKSMERASVSSDGTQGDNSSSEPSISGDGRYVVFDSAAGNLVPNGNNGYYDVFVHDRLTGQTNQVNLTNSGTDPSGGALQPKLSTNGRYVTFVSGSSGLVPGDTNNDSDVFVRDLVAGTTVRVSVGTNGTQAENGFFGPGWPSISSDGRFVAFSSDDLTIFPEDSIQDIYIRDRDTDNDGIFDEDGAVETLRANVSTGGEPGNAQAYFPVISGNGRFVAFQSWATNLVPGITDKGGIYVRDLQTKTTSFLAEGTDPTMSEDGRYLVYRDSSSRLYLMDRDSDQNGIYDEPQGTTVTDLHSWGTAHLSADGRYIAFAGSTELLPDDNDQDDVYIYDTLTKAIKRVSVSKTGWPGNGYSSTPSISSDGSIIAFASEANNLVPGDTNNYNDIFVAELDLNAQPDREPPAAPGSLQIQEFGSTWASLSWNPATDNLLVTRYEIFRADNPQGPFSKVATIDGTVTNYWDTTLSPDTPYYIFVKAGDEDGNWSQPSNTVSLRTQPELARQPASNPLAAGYYHSVAVRDGGSVWAWGENRYGEAGDGTTIERDYPVQVQGLTDVVAVSAGQYFTVALKKDGTVWAWGKNDYGQLGDGTANDSTIPVQVRGPEGQGFLSGIVAISAGGEEGYVLALRSDGTVWAWGCNYDGRLGNEVDSESHVPVPVRSPDGTGYLTDVVSVAAGGYHSLAVRRDGSVWAWGANWSGQLGISSNTDWNDHVMPSQVLNASGTAYLSGITAVAAGSETSLALKNDGTVWAWGDNYYGQLGNGSTYLSSLPVQVKDQTGQGYLSGIKAIASGAYHSLALTGSGTLWAWGDGYEGKLGNGSTVDRSAPAQVLNQEGQVMSGITQAAAGYDHTLALLNDNSMLSWGASYSGQLGNASKVSSSYPVAVLLPVTNNAAPAARNVAITGVAQAEHTLTASYEYSDAEGDPEGKSILKWYADGWEIQGANSLTYPLTVNDVGKTITFEVTPMATSGTIVGSSVSSLPTAQITPYFTKTWTNQILDTTGGAGRYSSTAYYGGTQVSYQNYNGGDEDLKYAYQKDGVWLTETVDSNGRTGFYTSLAVDGNGIPHISYQLHNSLDYRLKYAVKNGSAWTIEDVDIDNYPGEWSSIALDTQGNPNISYNTSSSTPVLKFASKSAGAWKTETVDNGTYSSLALDTAGTPQISYYDKTNADLKYATKVNGSWQLVTVDSTGSVGAYSSLKLDSSGNPHISYIDSTNSKVKHAYKDTTGWHTEVVGPTGSQALSTSLSLAAAGNPQITYVKYLNDWDHVLVYAYKDELGWHSVNIPESSYKYLIEARPSLVLDPLGNPFISFYASGLELSSAK